MIDCDLELTSRDTLLISSLESQLHSSEETIRRLDQKATSVVLLANGVIGFFGVSRFETYLSAIVSGNNPILSFFIVLFAGIYIVMMVSFIKSVTPEPKSIGIIKSDWDEVTTWRDYSDRHTFLDNIYSTYIQACEENRYIVASKAKTVTLLYICLGLLITLLLLSSLYSAIA